MSAPFHFLPLLVIRAAKNLWCDPAVVAGTHYTELLPMNVETESLSLFRADA